MANCERTPCDLPLLMRTLCLRCQDLALARGVRLVCAGNASALRVRLEAAAVRRALLAGLTAALCAAPRGGTVRMRLTAMGDAAEIAVEQDRPSPENGTGPRPFAAVRGFTLRIPII